jgi:pSer/pThr/pTyr-binding forkhead associated (FHA) protein
MEKLYHIGRDKINNEIFIIDDSISQSHAQIFVDKNIDLTIIDLSSKNGTFVNNKKIDSPFKLKNQDKIRLGSISFSKENLLNAIKLYENNDLKKNISFASTIENDKPKQDIEKKSSFKKVFYITIIALITLFTLIAGLYYNNSQNTIKEKIDKDRIDKIERIELSESNNVGEINNSNLSNENDIVEIIKEKETNQVTNVVKQRTDLVYDFTCLSNQNDEGTGELILEFGEITRNVQNTLLNDIKISINEEKKQGDEYVESIKKEKNFITTGAEYLKLDRIMKDLIPLLAEPRGVTYKMFLVDDNVKNVFTIGGNIIFHKGMYDFCKSDSEIAALISHEIAHNELGHSVLALKKQKASKDTGIIGELVLFVEDLFSASFNQKQESEADMFGLDLMFSLSYDKCASIDLLKRFSKNENDFNIIDNLFRSHPYSKNRVSCLKNHLKTNYNLNCD